MEVREAAGRRHSLAPGRSGRVERQHDRLQRARRADGLAALLAAARNQPARGLQGCRGRRQGGRRLRAGATEVRRSEEHTSELQSLMRISYAVFCLKTKQMIHTNE